MGCTDNGQMLKKNKKKTVLEDWENNAFVSVIS